MSEQNEEEMTVSPPSGTMDKSDSDDTNSDSEQSNSNDEPVFASVATIARPSTSDDVTNGDSDITSGVVDAAKVCEEFARNLKTLYPRYLGEVGGTGMAVPLLLHSAAFCDALMKENVKTKTQLEELNQKYEALQKNSKQHLVKVNPSGHSMTAEENVELVTKLQSRVKKLESQRTEILRVNRQWDAQYRRLKHEFDTKSAPVAPENSATTLVKFQGEPGPSGSSGSGQSGGELKRRKDVDVLLMNAKKEIRALMQDKGELARNFANAHSLSQSLKRELNQSKEVRKKVESEKRLLESENQRLNLALESAYSIQHQRSSIPSVPLLHSSGERHREQHPLDGDVYNALDAEDRRRSSSSRTNLLDEMKTQVEVLQEQVKIYREDFETERRDREKSQAEKQKLLEELVGARHELSALQQQLAQHEADFKQEKRDKERLKRQISTMHRESSSGRSRYHGDNLLGGNPRTPLDPPDYFAHRFNGGEENFHHRGALSRRRPRSTTNNSNSQETGRNRNHHDWLRHDDVDIERMLSYPPPEDARDQTNPV